jgi:hypothetical protein
MSNFGNSSKQYLSNNWKPILWGLLPLVILAIVFALPIKVVPVAVTERYMDTEIQEQPYTVQEIYEEEEAYTDMEMLTETVYDSYTYTYNWSYSFEPKPNAEITLSISGYPYYYQTPFIYWTDNVSGPVWPGSIFSYWDGWNSTSRVAITQTYPSPVTKYRVVTKTRDVLKYREVEVEVEKERTVTRYYRMSIWSYIFMDKEKVVSIQE